MRARKRRIQKSDPTQKKIRLEKDARAVFRETMNKLVFSIIFLSFFAIGSSIGFYYSYGEFKEFEKNKMITKVQVVKRKQIESNVGKTRYAWTLVNQDSLKWEYDTPDFDEHKIGDTLSIVYNKTKMDDFMLRKDYGDNQMTLAVMCVVSDSLLVYLICMLLIKKQRKKVLRFFENHVVIRPGTRI